MAQDDLKLLDCTLRDGGYVNDWKWGYHRAKGIIQLLVRAGVDIVEVGFLRNVDNCNPNITVCSYIEELNKLLPEKKGNTMFSAMAMRGAYDISKLSPYNGTGIEMLRITAHDYDLEDGMNFAQEVKKRGYKISINPINIMGYSDEKILWIIQHVNNIHPYQFSIVDTFGSMKWRDLDRIVSLVDNNLDKDIRVALHLHENMSLSCSLAQKYIDKHLNRPVSIDGSLMGMGRIPGNLPIELIADYLNDYTEKKYDIDFLMDAIQDYIAPMKGDTKWGYSPAYFLSARYNLHRNYAEYYLKKGDLTNRDINHILSRFNQDKTTNFDAIYADKLYEEYKSNRIDDTEDRKVLKNQIQGKNILIIAPGASINTYRTEISRFIQDRKPVVMAVNFIPEEYKIDFAFFSNYKRLYNLEKIYCKTIITSNISETKANYYIDYNSLSGAFTQGCNSLIMLLKLLKDMQVKSITVAGADGYMEDRDNYCDTYFRNYTKHDNNFNFAVSQAIDRLGVLVYFLTPSAYDI